MRFNYTKVLIESQNSKPCFSKTAVMDILTVEFLNKKIKHNLLINKIISSFELDVIFVIFKSEF